MKIDKAFTLAEVLITLGIIGVVSALTLPVLIQKYNNQVVETRLKKVYSIMNQAILMSEAQNGQKEQWDFSDEKFWDKYFAPYVKTVKKDIYEADNQQYQRIYFPDGSLMLFKIPSNLNYFYYPNAKNFNSDTFNDRSAMGKTLFLFDFVLNSYADINNALFKNGFQPVSYGLNQDLSNLYQGHRNSCNKESSNPTFCTFAIMQNGWKIPANYPFKVK